MAKITKKTKLAEKPKNTWNWTKPSIESGFIVHSGFLGGGSKINFKNELSGFLKSLDKY